LWRLILEKLPFFALSAASSIVTVWAQQQTGALRSFHAVPMSARLVNALTAYQGYLEKLIWPADLAVLYPLPSHWPWTMVLGAALALAGISFLAWRQRERAPWLPVGWCWFLGTLVPVIGLVQVGEQAMADRYTYLPLIGLFLALAWGSAAALLHWQINLCRRATVAVISLGACLLITAHQLGYWRDSRTLFEHALAVTRNNPVAHNNLGLALAEEGRADDAIREYVEALRLQPAYLIARNNLAVSFASRGRVNEAMGQLSEALRQQPNDPVTRNNLGSLLAQQSRWPEAIEQFSAALHLQPEYAMARLHLAEALSRHGQTAEAIAQYRFALRLRPQWPQALNQLAALLATHCDPQFRDGAAALRLSQQAIALVGDAEPAYLNTLAAAHAEIGSYDQALTIAQRGHLLAERAGRTNLAAQIRERLKLYEAGRPWRELP
jgi:tetratricopeptide (TPR) repeat protein